MLLWNFLNFILVLLLRNSKCYTRFFHFILPTIPAALTPRISHQPFYWCKFFSCFGMKCLNQDLNFLPPGPRLTPASAPRSQLQRLITVGQRGEAGSSFSQWNLSLILWILPKQFFMYTFCIPGIQCDSQLAIIVSYSLCLLPVKCM